MSSIVSKVTERQVRNHLQRRGKQGIYYLIWMVGGYRIYRSLHTPDPQQALRIALEIFAKLDQRRPSRMTLSQLRDLFAESTNYSSGYKANICLAFNSLIGVHGDARLSAIRRRDVLVFKSALEQKVRREDKDSNKKVLVSGHWVNGVMRMLRSAFNYAIAMEWLIGENPFSRFKKSVEMERLAHSYRPDEIRMLLDGAAAMFGTRFAAALELYLLTGVRRETGVKITQSMVDRRGRNLIVPAEIMKKKRDLLIPLSGRAFDLFQQLSGFERPIKYDKNTISHNFEAVRDKLGLGGTFHDIRKTTNTWLAEVGLVDVFRRKVLGHVDRDVNARNYTSYEIEVIRDAMEKIAAKIPAPDIARKVATKSATKIPESALKYPTKTAKLVK